MSSYSQFYQFQAQPQVLGPPNAFYTGQYESQRSKTPTSLINHTGHSPGPLSTPPLSRNASRGPEPAPDQVPEQMVSDDAFGSLSNSPVSVRTPDYDSFEVDMLDSSESLRNFYQSQNGNIMTSQVSNEAIPSIETNMFFAAQNNFANQVMPNNFNGASVSQPQQYQTQFTMQTRPLHNTLPTQPINTFFNQNFTNQPRQEPWTSQGPPRNPNEPRSGIAVFDPQSDLAYSAFVNDVNIWTTNNTDPAYLISPNDPMLPPQDLFSIAANQTFLQHQAYQRAQDQSQTQSQSHSQNSSPIEMMLTRASPSPDSQGFVNFDANSALITDNYITHPSPSPSPVRPSIELPFGSSYQTAPSPQASAPSPGGSDGVYSSISQQESDMMMDAFPTQQFNARLGPPPSPVDAQRSPTRTSLEVTFDVSPEPEPSSRRKSDAKGNGRPGGRALGTHLEPRVAKAAHDMRKIVACWHCVLQRDKCGPGDICERCMKRSQRPNADCGLGCSRIKLVELAQSFLPMLVYQIHEDTHLTHFVSQFIQQWGNVEITIYMTCGQKSMPRIPVKVYEFAPRGNELLVQYQYQTNPTTLERFSLKKESPALGMVHINHNEEKKYDQYISNIVDNHLDAFGDICWAEDDNDFAPRLFKLMTRVKPKNDDETKLLREVFRLIVSTYIMSHTITIAEETKVQTLSRMHSYTGPHKYVQHYTSPRMANRQLKYFFARLQRSILSTVLNKLQQIFKSSKGCDKWLAAFITVVGMAMAHEDQQKTIHQVMQTRAMTEGFDPRDAQAQADIAAREIDARMSFIAQIFRWKYNRKCNPLKDPEHNWDQEVGFGDESSVTFVRSVAQLVKDNIDYLQQRQGVSISSSNQAKYTARLVGSFLLSFWLPQ